MKVQMELPAFRELPAETRAVQRAELVARVAAPSRRPLVAAIAAACAVLLATPAFAFRAGIVDFWAAEPAPERVQLQFERMRTAFGTGPDPIPANAREVTAITLDGERLPLWVAPTETGGFCWSWHHVGACGADGVQLGLVSLQSDGGGPAWAAGTVTVKEAAQIEVRYEDGSVAPVPFVWVSEPIDAGFVLFDVPPQNEREGHRPVEFVALDADGRELASQPFRYGPRESGSSG
jgi:hypothetical protein